MRVEIGPPVAGDLEAAPLSRALVNTAAHAPMRSRMLVHVDSRPLTPPDRIPVSTVTLDARSPEPAEPTVAEDLWAHPTSDLADLVAQVLAALTEVRRLG